MNLLIHHKEHKHGPHNMPVYALGRRDRHGRSPVPSKGRRENDRSRSRSPFGRAEEMEEQQRKPTTSSIHERINESNNENVSTSSDSIREKRLKGSVYRKNDTGHDTKSSSVREQKSSPVHERDDSRNVETKMSPIHGQNLGSSNQSNTSTIN